MIQYSFCLPWGDEEDNKLYAYLDVDGIEENIELPQLVRGVIYFNICLLYRNDTLDIDKLKLSVRKSISYLDEEEEAAAKVLIELIVDNCCYISIRKDINNL